MWDDFKLAVRTLSRTPVFAVLVCSSLALGFAACTIAFCLIDAVEFRPLPFHPTGALAVIQFFRRGPDCLRACRSGLTQAEFDDWRHSLATSESLAEIRLDPAIMSDEAGTAIGEGAAVTPNFFSLLGIRASRGRLFDSSDVHAGSDNVVILSDALWRRRYRADPSVLARTLKLDSATFQVVGILPPDATIGRPLFNADTVTAQFFVPLKRMIGGADVSKIDESVLLARLRPGARLAALRANVEVALARTGVVTSAPRGRRTALVLSLRAAHARAVDAGSYLLLLAIVALVLLLTCANVAGVFLARLHIRSHDLQVRNALGCSPIRLTRHCAAEGVLCTVFAALIGVAGAVPILTLSTLLPRFSVPFWTPIVVDRRTLLCAFALVVITATVVGVVPAVAIRHHLARAAWRDVNTTVAGGRRIFVQRLVLIGIQIQIAVVLLSAAGLLGKTVLEAQTRDLGRARHSVITLDLATVNSSQRLTSAEQRDMCERLLRRLEETPGVSSAAADLTGTFAAGIRRDGSPELLSVGLPVAPDLVTPAFFRAWQIPLVEGRVFTAHDATAHLPVTILDKETAARLFPQGHAVGQHISLGDSATSGASLTVIGVVGTIQRSLFPNEATPFYPALYLQLGQDTSTSPVATFVIHTRGSSSVVEPFVRVAVHDVAPAFPIVRLVSFAREIDARTSGARLNAVVVGALAIFALVIASLGVFALVSQLVASRLREAGVRLALGAPAAHVLWVMMRPPLVATAVGVLGGSVGALAATRLIRGFLYGDNPADPAAFLLAIVALTSAALLAAYVAARRALRVEPSAALRSR